MHQLIEQPLADIIIGTSKWTHSFRDPFLLYSSDITLHELDIYAANLLSRFQRTSVNWTTCCIVLRMDLLLLFSLRDNICYLCPFICMKTVA